MMMSNSTVVPGLYLDFSALKPVRMDVLAK